jgi:monoamine oxidase
VIVGGGLAGLCAALELERRGHDCTILEAETKHVGGRARTLRFEDGLYGEAGAMRVPLGHTLTRHYVKELGLDLRPFVQSNDQAYVFARGRRARMKDVKHLASLYDLAPGERDQSPDDLWNASLVRRLEALSAEEAKERPSSSWPSRPAWRRRCWARPPPGTCARNATRCGRRGSTRSSAAPTGCRRRSHPGSGASRGWDARSSRSSRMRRSVASPPCSVKRIG